jgi:hypothetical protein
MFIGSVVYREEDTDQVLVTLRPLIYIKRFLLTVSLVVIRLVVLAEVFEKIEVDSDFLV